MTVGTESLKNGGATEATSRSREPVFVMGCHRSGTNLLYDTLLSAGGFAMYRGMLPVYQTLLPRFGALNVQKNRQDLMQAWLRSKGFRRSGLNAEQIRAKVLDECRNGGDFFRIVMGEVARSQKAARWAAYDPDNVLYVRQIKRELPGALFIHIIRDGRDIAVSLTQMGGFRPFPWDGARSLQATALYWEWMVRRGREQGSGIAPDYLEVHYEDLVTQPRETLARLSHFLDHDLDYDRIQAAGLGRVREPNSSFAVEARGPQFNPVERWKTRLSQEQVVELEGLVGESLQEFGYPLTTAGQGFHLGLRAKIMRVLYPWSLDTKLWLKSNTPLGRLVNTKVLEIEP